MDDMSSAMLVGLVLFFLLVVAPGEEGRSDESVVRRQPPPPVTPLEADNTADAPPPPTIPVLARPVLAGPSDTPTPEPGPRPTHHHHAPEPPPAPPPGHIPEPWASLAQCESGGRWGLPHDPYSGGLQFAHSSWVGNGGLEYAPHAHLATAWQQIAVARSLQQAQGWSAWPDCARELGLL